MVHIEPPQSGNPRNARMHEIGSVERMSGHIDLPRACYLDLQLVDYQERTILVGASTTRGELRGWCVRHPLPGGTDLSSCELHWLLHAQPIPPYNVITKPALNCLSLLSYCNSDSNIRLHLAVGVDDGSVRIASVASLRVPSESESSEPRWIASAVHHFAAVVRICAKSDRLFFTLSADQRVVCWSFNAEPAMLTPLHRVMLSGSGDPHGMDIAFDSSDHSKNDLPNTRTTYILTTGIGTILLRWSCK
ncbi:hypothetical protein FBUS_01626 [Fasciolopsis buskii]|uniref:Uncharacterized protein n=1 Tax=Fasciolopsis buskii TaxID=27845 RepID=A0A8E0VLD7_9TREM|nr:hypothetical protein FBUS_01626 [Fasciolopsis buski]